MHYLIGWGLLGGVALLLWLLIRISGPAGESKASCGTGGCGHCASSAPPASSKKRHA